MSFQYKKNMYICEACFNRIVTIDRDAGVTPFLISCSQWINKDCDSRNKARSVLYRISQDAEPTHEWYRSNPDEIAGMKNPESCLDHHKNGGLFLRKIPEQTN